MKSHVWGLASWAVAMMFVAVVTSSGALTAPQLKAAYILNFARFIEWPESGGRRGVFVVGVLGDDNVGDALEETITGKTVRGRPVSVRRYRTTQEVRECEVLFIPAAAVSQTKAALAQLGRAAVLTISDVPDFVNTGGAIGFVTEGERVRFDINLRALSACGLKASAQLLEVARSLKGAK